MSLPIKGPFAFSLSSISFSSYNAAYACVTCHGPNGARERKVRTGDRICIQERIALRVLVAHCRPQLVGFQCEVKSELRVLSDVKSKIHHCLHCGYSTRFKSTLNQHIKAVHERRRDHEYPECTFSASAKSNLKAHIKS